MEGKDELTDKGESKDEDRLEKHHSIRDALINYWKTYNKLKQCQDRLTREALDLRVDDSRDWDHYKDLFDLSHESLQARDKAAKNET